MYFQVLSSMLLAANALMWKRLREAKRENDTLKAVHSLAPAAITPGSDIGKPALYSKPEDDARAEKMISDINADFWKQRQVAAYDESLDYNAQLVSGM